MRTRSPPGTAHGSATRRPLGREGGVEGGPGGGEDGVETVAGRLHHPAAVRRSTASRSSASWRSSAGTIAAGCCSQSRVEPSRSVNRNVTVPDGSSGTSPPGLPDARMIARPSRLAARSNPVPGAPAAPPILDVMQEGPTAATERERVQPELVDPAAEQAAVAAGETAAAEATLEGPADESGEQITQPHQAHPHRVDGAHDARRGAPRAARRRRPPPPARDPRAVARGARGRPLPRPPAGARARSCSRSPARRPASRSCASRRPSSSAGSKVSSTASRPRCSPSRRWRRRSSTRCAAARIEQAPAAAHRPERVPVSTGPAPRRRARRRQAVPCSSGRPTAGARSRPRSSPTGPTPPRSKPRSPTLRAVPPLVFAGEARSLTESLAAVAERRGLRAAGRRLRGVVRRVLGQRHPRQAQGHPADGGRAHLRQRRARR